MNFLADKLRFLFVIKVRPRMLRTVVDLKHKNTIEILTIYYLPPMVENHRPQ